MNTSRVATQAELDQAIADQSDTIYIDSPTGAWLTVPTTAATTRRTCPT